MSKQTTRQLTRQERRRESQQRREEERRRAARRKRIITVGLIAAGVLVIAFFAYFVMAQGRQGQTSANAAYPAIDGATCDTNEHFDIHIHAHLSIYIDGKPASIPAQVGIAPDGSCLYWLHTHDNSGVIHIEAPNGFSVTLKNFLDVWGGRFSQLNYSSQLSNPTGWQAYVNGKPFAGDFRTIALQSHTLVTLAYNSPGVTPDTIFNWNGL
jgi:hypothetical protein